jgi:hypothetical protein
MKGVLPDLPVDYGPPVMADPIRSFNGTFNSNVTSTDVLVGLLLLIACFTAFLLGNKR